LGVGYDGKTFGTTLGEQVFFKVNVDPTAGYTLIVDDSKINGGFTYISSYRSNAELNDYLPTPSLGAGGVQMYGLTTKKVGSFTFRLVSAQSYDGDWVAY